MMKSKMLKIMLPLPAAFMMLLFYNNYHNLCHMSRISLTLGMSSES
jgi:hypothetical protein